MSEGGRNCKIFQGTCLENKYRLLESMVPNNESLRASRMKSICLHTLDNVRGNRLIDGHGIQNYILEAGNNRHHNVQALALVQEQALELHEEFEEEVVEAYTGVLLHNKQEEGTYLYRNPFEICFRNHNPFCFRLVYLTLAALCV